MRIRIADRILVGLAGLLLLAACAALVAQVFFGVDVSGFALHVLNSENPQVRAGLIGIMVFLLLLGLYCLFVLFRHRSWKEKFVLQKNDNGELAISIKALEGMVQKCLDQHPELEVNHTYLENRKDGLLIRIRGQVAGGISIPLTMEALQREMKQYVTACSGVEVKGIRVQIDTSGADAEDAPFAIAAPSRPLLKEAEEAPIQQTPVQQTEVQPEPAAVEPAPAAQPASEPVVQMTQPVMDDDDDRPLHQRIFSAPPEACIVPEASMEEESYAMAFDPEAAGMGVEVKAHDQEPEDLEEPAAGEEIPVDIQEESEAETEDEAGEPEIEAPAEEEQERQEADPEYLESLKAFDDMVSGAKE